MKRTKKASSTTEEKSFIDKALENVPRNELSDLPLETFEDYMEYNRKARQLNKKLGLCRYPIKQCPEELHPKERVIFNRRDQPSNPQPVYLSNEMIEFKKTLIPGKTYDLPRCVVDYLQSKGTSVWKWYTNPDGSKETRISHHEPRFSLRTVYSD